MDSATGDGGVPSSIASPIPSGENSVWADVTHLLKSACEDLREGELIHGENFDLFAAMSTLEIMDPKMDSGIVTKYYSIDEAIENGAAPVPLSFDRTVDIQCVIDVMDHLLACEATWHKGQSLAQTVFSCIYLLRPDLTSSHPLLHSYCRVIRATCKAAISTVSNARTHEEEDYFILSHGLPLHGDGDDKCLSILNAVEETVSRQLRACKSHSLKKRVPEDIEPLQTIPELEEGYCKAVLCRLRFRKHFYHLLTTMRRPQGRGLELAKKHVSSCLSELELMQKSAAFLRCEENGITKEDTPIETTASGCHPIGFDATLNSRICTSTPPRSIKTLSWVKATQYFKKLLEDLDIVCSNSLDQSLDEVLRFVVQFQKAQPDLVARSHLQVLLVEDGKLYGRDSMFQVISRAAALPQIPPNHEIQKHEYIVQLGQLIINLLKILCTNAAWQRRKLGKVLQDWRVIYMQLEMAFQKDIGQIAGIFTDQNLCKKVADHILMWVEEQTYWIAFRFLVLGFELELYSPAEYCMVYWYMYVVLIAQAEKAHLRMSAIHDTAKRKGKKKRDSLKDAVKDHQIHPAVLFLQCKICIAEGLAVMIAALRTEHMNLQIQSPFNREQERFMQHFDLLQKASIPDRVSYVSFKECTAYANISTLPMYNYFKDAQKLAKELKGNFSNDSDRMSELRKLEQVAEHNSVALNLISRLGNLDSSLKVSLEFNHHPYFATVVVKRS
uniref:N-alpha-acetyltransferase 35, NatC auxiliary subunit n=1 Tax=Kalanchoe fedtschenkoi TaxID=63787 RepID=A0A7N1A2U2_KALFE